MKIFLNLKNIFVFCILCLCFNFNFVVNAADNANIDNAHCDLNKTGLSTIGLDLLSDPTGRSCPDLSGDLNVNDVISLKIYTIVRIVFGFFATIGLIAFVYAGVTILLSNGDAGVYKKGWDIIRYTFTGMIIMIFSYAISNFIFSTIPSFTGAPKSNSDSTSTPSSVVSCSSLNDCSGVADSYCCTDSFDGCTKNTCVLLSPGDSCGLLGGKCYKKTDTANISNKTITGDGFCSKISGWDCYK